MIWVTAMVFLGTADVLIQWWNWVTLSSEQLNRGLVVGAPPKVRKVSPHPRETSSEIQN